MPLDVGAGNAKRLKQKPRGSTSTSTNRPKVKGSKVVGMTAEKEGADWEGGWRSCGIMPCCIAGLPAQKH